MCMPIDRAADGPEIVPIETIKGVLGDAEKLLKAEQFPAALLLCWAAFEAFARNQLQSTFARPQTPGRIVEILAGDGILTPTEADKLRLLARQRNNFIHGALD